MAKADSNTKQQSFRYGPLSELDDSFDRDFWASASLQEKFTYAWTLVEQAVELQGKDKNELKFQKSLATLQRWPS